MMTFCYSYEKISDKSPNHYFLKKNIMIYLIPTGFSELFVLGRDSHLTGTGHSHMSWAAHWR